MIFVFIFFCTNETTRSYFQIEFQARLSFLFDILYKILQNDSSSARIYLTISRKVENCIN